MQFGTHDGTFHYDEILATAVLLELWPKTPIIRTRDAEQLAKCNIVYDVGGVFDPQNNRFDHHQSSFVETYSEQYNIKLSSAGLIYKYFCDALFKKYSFEASSEVREYVKDKIYREFFLFADALDNGYEIFSDIIPRTLASLVAGFNVYTNKDYDKQQQLENDAFMDALKIVQRDLKNYMEKIFYDYVPAYEKVYNEIKDLQTEIFITEQKYSPDVIFDVDKKLKKDLKFIIFKNRNEFRILALPLKKGGFKTRVPLLHEWCGKRDAELVSVSNIPECIFVHATGFTGSNKTLEGALEMCKISLAAAQTVCDQ
ncbi:hypothetical protein ENBRE01_0035 [Enteropsectra breve]|nr:hypothetical protein ENBRE01_0035 [Enteropsectra breve]